MPLCLAAIELWDMVLSRGWQEPVSLGDYRKVLWSPRGEGDTVPSTSVGMLGGEEDYSLLTDQAALLVDQDVRPATHKLYKNRFSIFSTY